MADRVVTVIPAKKTFARSSESNAKRVAAYARVTKAQLYNEWRLFNE